MRIACPAATLALVLAASACGTTPTQPGGDHALTREPGRPETVSPHAAAPLKGGNMIGSGY
jgi:hypothetical protein